MALDFLKRASKSPSSSKESEDGFDRAAYERRRQQVRRAQRNHRERKANYVKALEHEVSNLRKQNQHNIRELESEVQMLQTILLSLGQQPPPRQARLINPAVFDPNHPSSYTVSKPAGLGHALRLEVPEIDFSSSVTPTVSKDAHPTNLAVPHAGATPSDADMNFASTPVGNDQSLPHVIDKVHGINFVLSFKMAMRYALTYTAAKSRLEHACMGHPEVTREGFGTHSHMVSHSLLSHAPQDVGAATAWEIPGANIEKLLALSNTFQLLGEITPVQGWYKLKEHPGFMSMNQRQLEQLSRLLAPDAKCYGFGAVVEEQIWSLAVEEVLSRQSP